MGLRRNGTLPRLGASIPDASRAQPGAPTDSDTSITRTKRPARATLTCPSNNFGTLALPTTTPTKSPSKPLKHIILNEWLDNQNIDLIGIQETRHTHRHMNINHSHLHIRARRPRHRRRCTTHPPHTDSQHPPPPRRRASTPRHRHGPETFYIAVGRAPPTATPPDTRFNWWTSFAAKIRTHRTVPRMLVFIDANTQEGDAEHPCPNYVHSAHNFAGFLRAFDLRLAHTTAHESVGQPQTWTSPASTMRHIDYTLD